jgi:hypothetical protein
MIFDDHEITDDWNITPGWSKRTRSSDLGRAILRNGLAAATLFQMWGNDPRWYRSGMGRDVLQLISQMYAEATPDKPDADQATSDALDKLFDLVPRTPGSSRMRWDYRYDGPGFEVLALDSRTWRGFEPNANPQIQAKFSDDATATLLTDEALQLQIPEQPAVGVNPDGTCFVIAGAPVLGFPVVESAVQPIINLVDIASKSRKPPPPFTTLKSAFAVGRVKHDPEPWGFEPSLFEAVLARLASRRRVVFLSGDVHYSFTLKMSYYRNLDSSWNEGEKTRFIQLTSSSFRQLEAPAPIAVVDLIQQFGGAAAKQQRWGWHRGAVGTSAHDPPLVAGPNPFGTHLDLLLAEDPIVVSPGAVPDQTKIIRIADWAWVTEAVGDVRPDEDRLATLHPPRFSNQSQIDTLRTVGERHFWQAQNAMPRNWHWWTNFTTVEFGRDTHNQDVLRHKVWAYDPLGTEPTVQPFLLAEVALAVADHPPRPPP